MYNLIISLYAAIVHLISPFHRKARLMVCGHRDTYRKLKQEVVPGASYIWLHAASLGEFEQGRPIIEKIKANYPTYKILLTFFSPSGYEVRKDYPLADIVCYLPFDRRSNVRKFFKLVHPCIAIFIKYEFWYNYINALGKLGIPTYMVSAIFRPGQVFFKWYGKSYRNMLRCYRRICVQDESSKQLLESIDVADNVQVCGDTRFDRVLEVKENAKELPLVEAFIKSAEPSNQFVLVAGSSWPKDEDIFIEYFNKNKHVKLIIAPHEVHEAHLAYIEESLKRPAIRYSQAAQARPEEYDCLIIDSFGLLSSLYRYGHAAYIGGGFGVGIHNVLEAAVYGIPVIFGPNFRKFREANRLVELGGGYPIHNAESFFVLMDEFIQYPEVRNSAGTRSGKYVCDNAGVVDKVMAVLNLKQER
jgi:3-deoxy-D-manno-octulosonic-acid transferase